MIPLGERILLTLWVGGLWAIGFIAVPSLFASLDDRALAGSLAGVRLETIAWIGLLCGLLLMAANQLRYARRRVNWRLLVLLAMLMLVAAGQFLLAPMIADLRAAGQVDSAGFAWLHGLASGAYLVTSLLGLLLVAAGQNSGNN